MFKSCEINPSVCYEEDDLVIQCVSKSPLDYWIYASILKTVTPTRRITQHISSSQQEFAMYLSGVNGKAFTHSQSRGFWIEAQKVGKYDCLSRLVRLLMVVPSSTITQERDFSELKLRCVGLRARKKVETLNRYGVVYAWMDKIAGNN